MKKVAKNSGAGGGFGPVLSRKKRKGSVLAKSVLVGGGVIETTGNHSQNSETGNTTEFKNVNMEEECLIEETSINYSEKNVFDGENPNQTPKSSGIKIKTKKVLGKPLGKINFEDGFDNGDFLNESALFLPSLLLKPSVHVFVRKSFALNIDLVAKKLNFIKKIFSDVNGFEGASIFSKFGGIIHATFTSEMAMMAAEKLAHDCNVVINTNLKHPDIVIKEIPVDTLIEAVCATVSKFGVVVLIKMQLVGLWQKAIWFILIRKNAVWVAGADVDKQTCDFKNEFKALLYTFPVRTNTHDLWAFIGSVGGKTCVIECNSVNYTWAHCATVCFESESNLNRALANTLVINGVRLHWSCLFAALCFSCNSFGHISRNCKSAGVFSNLKGKRASLLAQDWFRLAKIYERKFASVSRPLAFGGKTWASVLGSIRNGKPLPPVVNDLEKRLVSIESSLVSLMGQIGELAKRLESFVPAVSQPSLRCQLPVTPLLQNQGENIVMGMGLGDATNDKTAAVSGSTASLKVVKLENMLEDLSALVMSLSAHLDDLALAGGAPSLPLS
ncbi:hypothetical protein G9A89_001333 [Geosiphon pyriformis]|nr:hypothetical protein G9A89_001333 [Geosiphon pyriformis]